MGQPAAIAGPILKARFKSGKFHAKNATATPTPPRANMESTLVNFRKPTSQIAEAANTTEGMVLQYPYENQDYYMAAIKFSLYKIDPYEIDAEAAKNIIETMDIKKKM